MAIVVLPYISLEVCIKPALFLPGSFCLLRWWVLAGLTLDKTLVVLEFKESTSFSAFTQTTRISSHRHRSNVLTLLYRSYPNSVCTQVVKLMYLRANTNCIPLGRARYTSLLEHITDKFGTDFVQNKFTALGVTFYNDKSVEEIVNIIYNSKFEKAKSWVEIWSKRSRTLLGKVLIIKSLILSQFTYLVLPLPRSNYQMVNRLNTVIFHFLWDCKRDKMKRDIVTRSREEGGLGLVYPYDFILSLKLTLFDKLFDDNFNQPWKSIVLRQLIYPDHLVMTVENGAARRNYNFTQDVLNCYLEWRTRAVARNGGTID